MTPEITWQVMKALLGLLVLWAVVKYDLKAGERDCGVVTIAGGLAAFIGGVMGLLAKPTEALWISRFGFIVLVFAVIQWLRLNNRHLCA